jgi:hypothetical protein
LVEQRLVREQLDHIINLHMQQCHQQ